MSQFAPVLRGMLAPSPFLRSIRVRGSDRLYRSVDGSEGRLRGTGQIRSSIQISVIGDECSTLRSAHSELKDPCYYNNVTRSSLLISNYHNRFGHCIGYMADVGLIFNWCSLPRTPQDLPPLDFVESCGGEFPYQCQMEFYRTDISE